LLLKAARVVEAAVLLKALVADLGHIFQGLAVFRRHQLQPIGFRQFGAGQGADEQQG
jgi:hypothetical protein